MSNRIYIIAEAGVNHNGNLKTALQMIGLAKNSGADAIKFQTGIPELVISKYAPKAAYQMTDNGSQESQLDMCKKFTLDFDDFVQLKNYCEEIDIDFLSTPFDLDSVHFLHELDLSLWKIPSGEITNLPYLIEIAKTNKPVLLSTGMSELFEIHEAVRILHKYGSDRITLLQCNTEYPTPYRDVNLNALSTLRKEFSLPVGLSDHSLGIEVPIAGAALGAVVIEKHFTIDRNMEGPDHKASVEPSELKKMIEGIRHIEEAMGTGKKTCTSSEKKNLAIARKSIVASRKIHTGEPFTEENIAAKRPGNGISPMNWFDVIGRIAKKDFDEDECIQL